YVIDFEFSEILDLGPGEQTAIELPRTCWVEWFGHTHLDPYSFDVWLLAQSIYARNSEDEITTAPWMLRWYFFWLRGNEAGCLGVCICRPTVRRARQVLTGMRILVYVGDTLAGLLGLRPLCRKLW
ncbi:uncharacterized protein BXZ73DRAFT_24554, partial [Epithele typhae]|uniref:uncharacterized protein n=1 Tax=Epithele typhae TaxID=378194 RepID=UPI0020077870